ncbi:protein of unknown function [Methylocaldum szegediense]|uniref:Uncharacterized protein n=1 Tax=Methylocaldum szegediense TaxID=73780 RepID=A0ABN8WZ66_9GAMM|nr:protein of unknown function [Methylocaldum szegediense]
MKTFLLLGSGKIHYKPRGSLGEIRQACEAIDSFQGIESTQQARGRSVRTEPFHRSA